MLLAIDVGNTNTVLGIFDDDTLSCQWRIQSRVGKTSDEYSIILLQLLRNSGFAPEEIHAAIISSVVPPLQVVFVNLLQQQFNLTPLIIGPGIKTGMSVLYDNPKEVGADRIVNAVAAFEAYHCGLLVVDFGTATTFDAISPKGEYLGGAISPGIAISIEALFRHTAKLPRVELAIPKQVIGRNTVSSIQSGLIWGYTGLVEGIIQRFKEEAGFPMRVLATGGLATLIASQTKSIDDVDPLLTLRGLQILYKRNHR